MKKTISFFIIYFALYQISFTQTIPNSDFENWTTFGGWYDNPDYWTTNNSQIMVASVNKYTTAYHGTLAAQIITGGLPGWCQTQFPLTAHPSNLSAWVMTNISGTDTVFISIVLMSNGNVVDGGLWKYGSNITSYTFISIPITQNVNTIDSAVIHIQSGTNSGTYLIVDYLQFDVSTGIGSSYDGDNNCVIYPNPMTNQTNIRLNGNIPGNSRLTITDSYGKVVRTIENLKPGEFTIERGNLSSGLYFLDFDNGKAIISRTKLLVK